MKRISLLTIALVACASQPEKSWSIPPPGTALGVRFLTDSVSSPAPERCARFHAGVLGLAAREIEEGFELGSPSGGLRIEQADSASGELELVVDDVDALVVELAVRAVPFEVTADDAVLYRDPDGRRVRATHGEVTADR